MRHSSLFRHRCHKGRLILLAQKLVTLARAAALCFMGSLSEKVPENHCGVLAARYNPGGAPIRESGWQETHAIENG